MTFLKRIFHFGIETVVKITGLSEQFVLFLVMGGVNTLFYYGLYSLLIFAGVHYAAAVVVATCCGVLFNFQTFGRVVFKNFRIGLLGRFVGVYIVVMIANIAGLKGLDWIGLSDKYAAGAVLVLPVALLGYILNKNFVFNRPKQQSGNPPTDKAS